MGESKTAPEARPEAPEVLPACPFFPTRSDETGKTSACSCLGPSCMLWLGDDETDGDCAFVAIADALVPEPKPWVRLSAEGMRSLAAGRPVVVPSLMLPPHCPGCGLFVSEHADPPIDKMVLVQAAPASGAQHLAILTPMSHPTQGEPS